MLGLVFQLILSQIVKGLNFFDTGETLAWKSETFSIYEYNIEEAY